MEAEGQELLLNVKIITDETSRQHAFDLAVFDDRDS